jgi:hypothetical protein
MYDIRPSFLGTLLMPGERFGVRAPPPTAFRIVEQGSSSFRLANQASG